MTNRQNLPAVFNDSAAAWERVLYAFLAEKQRRSGSQRTLESYYGMLKHFFRSSGKTPEEVTSQDVFGFAHSTGVSGREPSAITIGARMSCLSSFYRFLMRMGIVSSNPCDMLERPKTQTAPPRGLTPEQVRTVLAAMPDTLKSRRDRAIIRTLLLTGRRRSEVLNLKAGDISFDDAKPFYTYRGKGGKRGRRELPMPALEAINFAARAIQLPFEIEAPPPMKHDERQVAETLSLKPIHHDEITRTCGLLAHKVAALLTIMEMKRLAKDVGGGHYVQGRIHSPGV